MPPSDRELRYRDKLFHVRKRLQNIDDWQDDFSEEKSKLAIYKAIQELTEALVDIVAMIAKDLNLNPRDDYSNFDKLYDHDILTKKQKLGLIEVNGLRNRLIHRYNGIDDDLAMRSYSELLPVVKEMMEVFDKCIQKFFRK